MHTVYVKRKPKMFGYHFVEPVESGGEWESNCHLFLLEPATNTTFPLDREVSFHVTVFMLKS